MGVSVRSIYSFLVLLVAILVLTACAPSPDDTVKQFLGHLQAGQHLRVQESLSKETYQMMVMFYGKITDGALKPYYRRGQINAFSVALIDKTDNSARYKVNIMNQTGDMFTDTIDLVKQDGGWKVSNF